MAIDFLLAAAHHLLVFSLAAILAAELVLVRPGLAGDALRRLARIDGHYGQIAGLVIVVGVLRVAFGLKDWTFYMSNPAFWAKMVAFAGVAFLSISPTRRFIRWRRAAEADPNYAVPAAEVDAIRRFLLAETAVFALIPIFAAAMARGIGM